MNNRKKQPNDEMLATIRQAINAYNGLCTIRELAEQHGILHLVRRLRREIRLQERVRDAIAAYDGMSTAQEVADKHGLPRALICQALTGSVIHNGRSGGHNKILAEEKERLLRGDVESGKVGKRQLRLWLLQHNSGVAGSKTYRDSLWKEICQGDDGRRLSRELPGSRPSSSRATAITMPPATSIAHPHLGGDNAGAYSTLTARYQSLSRSRSRARSEAGRCILVNIEQRQYRDDPRVRTQLWQYHEAQLSDPPDFHAELTGTGIDILEHVSAAQTSLDVGEADFIFGDCGDLERWLHDGTGDKLFLLRDEVWLRQRPARCGDSFLLELKAKGCKFVEVQDPGKRFTRRANCSVVLPIDDVIDRFRRPSGKPLNLLNLKSIGDGLVPPPLAKHCTFLSEAAEYDASRAATGGKSVTEAVGRAVDLQSCLHFQIFGQAGAISGWHMDSIGPYTYVTLEPNKSDQRPESVLKLWAYVRTDNLADDDREQVMRDFKRYGRDFRPNPKHVRILSLVAGDTLVMPPGTIHAPLTITDCLFRGGMVMQKKEARRSIRAWRFCAENGRCTNEDPPRQTRSVLEFFRLQILADPQSCGYTSEQAATEFEDDYRYIGGASLRCGCRGGCDKGGCGCRELMQGCGPKCHRGPKKCNNPNGCPAITS